ncbi:glycosyltransferase family 9 protein [Oceanibaculum nanhaiense]|uniref:glycosyltransferase family 9 protein n=1 Tax=Oceanibaculum nanhaiense TaxID=1909734 RepID=UPI001594DFC7|nr:glycosyltransferase family 9 protein [Oceanibaculum nanhaiense]
MADVGRYRRIAVYSGGEIIGDGVYKLSFLRALRGAFPNALIDWVCPGPTVYADRIAPLTAGLLDHVHANVAVGQHKSDLFLPLPIEGGYDLVIDTQQVVWRSLCARRLTARGGIFLSGAARFWLSGIRPQRGYVRPRHILTRFFDMIEMATGSRPALDRALPLPADLTEKARQQLPDGPAYIGFAPGAGEARKRWPLERFIEIARRQADRGRVPVFILGPAEAAELPAIRAAVPTALFPEQDTDLWGEGFNPMRSMAIGTRLAGALSNDSGVSHMLAAADTPLVVLYGHTSAEKFGPVTRHSTFLQASDYGAPVIETIPVEAVDEALEKLLA